MKELSIEEKAKRYDGAIKKFKPIYNLAKKQGRTIDVEEFENIFPELKESDDEKIISKEIISYIKNSTVCIDTDTFKKWIAWLEKQGKTSPILSNSSNIGKDEQKPAWSEEDENILNTIINHFKVDIECTDEDDIVRWLKSLKGRVQPKQEWSEEDEETLKDIITSMTNLKDSATSDALRDIYNSKIAWLKSIRPQSHWKPREEYILLLERMANGKSNPQDFQASLGVLIWRLKKLREE